MKEYERITKRTKFGVAIEFSSNEFKIPYCDDIEAHYALERLAELEDKIENGTLIEVDNKVYPPNKSIGVWGDYCSKCGGLIGENGYEENYCSHCGTKLKEQENE